MQSHPRDEMQFGFHASGAVFPTATAYTTPHPLSPMGTEPARSHRPLSCLDQDRS